MRAKEIHYYLLSLALRGFGFWMLFGLADRVASFANFLFIFFFLRTESTWLNIFQDGFLVLVHLILAAYFILGAPPFLKWATQANSPIDRP